MKTLFTAELNTRLCQREKELAEGKGVRVTRLEELRSEVGRIGARGRVRRSRTVSRSGRLR